MPRIVHQFANDVQTALSMVRRRYLYTFQASTVGQNTGVIRDRVRAAGRACHVSFRYKSYGDISVVNQIFQQDEYSLDERLTHTKALRAYYENLVNAGKTPLIFDAGANIGASAVYFSCLYPKSQIVAIEPERNNCALLKRNAQDRPIRVVEGAIGAETGTIYLSDPGLSDWGFRVADKGEYSVPVYTPDQLLAEYRDPKFAPLFFKVDIEGFEQRLFEKNLDWLSRFPMLVIETHDWMLPGQNSSKTFLRAVSQGDFDFLHVGENVYCFNTRLLGLSSAPAQEAADGETLGVSALENTSR